MGDQQSANTVTVPGSDEYRAKIKSAAKGAEDENLHPELILSKILTKNGGKAAVQNLGSSWPISGFMRFPLEHRIHPYTTTGNASFISSNNNVGQTYRLTVKGGGPGKSCVFKPKVMPLNIQSSYHDQGTLLPWSQEVTPAVPSEAAVVLNPLWDVNSASLVLLERHIEHHHLLGFNKYILYAYPEHVEYLTQSPTLLHWAQNDVLQIVTLDALPRYLDMPHFYQRLVYNHAVLSHLGSNMYLAMIDLDEYLVPLKAGLSTIFDMLGACAPPRSHRVNLLFPRYHVIAVGWSNRTASELPLWLSNGSAGSQSNHPLLRYTLVDLQHPPHSKAIVIPGFISNFFVHSATAFTPYNTTHLDSRCMALAHLKNLHKSRVTGGLMVEQRFKPDPIWGAALKGLSKLYKYQVSVVNSSNTNKKGGDESE
ncbi:hypothetical protein CEUSTIGMA_g10071.t1 [Chlamydomonas eustigma]|uniref:Glycosyltransferase family 92 protein n=1 Tax=Chlamydomonas eustigma TaxID=1157962 RepID=A0A250XHT1_9CHLO|nr:hypothetical protein CEUSTIGMA_g10071.t1 [Chlamydomonas eustigma]|eukprot:GAX82645.1 hypothetical protein CEUSTIGMA_g10071.t1 [Chlamydomonas eustigma]